MTIRYRRAAAVVALALLMTVAAAAQTANEAGTWRTSFAAFAGAIGAVPEGDLPGSKTEIGYLVGEREKADHPIMKRFGGRVEFEGTFQAVIKADRQNGTNHGSVVGSPFNTLDKLDIAMPWPEGLGGNLQKKAHIYPKASARAGWRALKPGTPVRFRAVVTGIARFVLSMPGAELQGLSILLEEAEVVR